MDEKRLLYPTTANSLAPASRLWRFTPLRLFAAGALLVFLLLHIVLRALPHSPHHHHGASGGPLRYPGEQVAWERCGAINGRLLECSNINVPMDQFNSENSGDKTFSIPLIRLRGSNATQSILLNPGGPGGSGVEFLYRKGKELSTIVGDGFHLLSFDPRGVNGSLPMASCYPDQDAYQRFSSVKGKWVLQDSPELYAWATNFGKACADVMGEHGQYIDTPQTAADMNSILEAIGQEKMFYWGFSYGTLLGQTYATLFPDRCHRVILDGVANQFDWYASLLDIEAMTDTEAVLDGFLEECIKAGDNCSFSSLADSKQGLWDRLLAFGTEIEEQPLSVYVNSTVYGTLDWAKVLYDAIFMDLYRPAKWSILADTLTSLLQGNATDMLLEYGLEPRFQLAGQAERFVTLNDGVSGPDYWAQDRGSLEDILAPFLSNGSMFHAAEMPLLFVKQQWPVRKTHNYVPRIGVETAQPLLLLSTSFDPICPLVSARNASAAFEKSQIVEVKGFGHCSLAVPSTCMAKHVRAFLYNGTIPDKHTQCERDGQYFAKPGEDGTAVAQKHFDDEDDMRLHLAQVSLATDWEWPRLR